MYTVSKFEVAIVVEVEMVVLENNVEMQQVTCKK